jgi:two-component system OmpR family response regulator
MPRTVLIVDDDAHIRDVIRFALEQGGFATIEADNGRRALDQLKASGADLVVLDIGLPELDGMEVCRAIRKTSDTPILFLSARDEEIDRIVGLEIGGDDYVTKPFSPRELVARVKAILKRFDARVEPSTADRPPDGDSRPLSHGSVVLDRVRHEVTFDGQQVSLTATEFAVLQTLMTRRGHVRDRASLIEAAYDDNIHVSDRTVDSHVRNVRAKLAAVGCSSIIETVHGVGYRLGRCR